MNYRETMSRLNSALTIIDSAYAVIAKKYGLTFNALMTICLIEESTPITQKKICDRLHLPKSTVHSILLDLMKEGLVELVTGNNKKEKFVTFTELGSRYFEEIFEVINNFEDKVLAALGTETCVFLVETAEKLGGIIENEIKKIETSEG